MSDDAIGRAKPVTLDVLREAFAGGETTKPRGIHLTLADRAAGKGAEIARKALAMGANLIVERPETIAEAAIREYTLRNPREDIIARERAAGRELARQIRR